MKNIKHKRLDNNEIYVNLMVAHSYIKDIMYDYEQLDTKEKNAMDAVDSTLYMAEYFFINPEKPN